MIPRYYQQLAVPIRRAFDLEVPFLRVKEDAVSFAAEPRKGFEDHDCVAEVGTACRVLAVGVPRPIDIFVAKGRFVNRGAVREEGHGGGAP